MNTPTTALLALLATALSVAAQAQAPDKKSPELQVLNRFVGTWDVDSTFKPAGGDAVNTKGVSHREWSRRGHFIHFDDPGAPGEPEFQMLLTHDSEAGTYPGVIMMGASRGEVTATWDEKAKTMSFTGKLDDGNKLESKHRFIDADRADTQGVVKTPTGEVVVELSGKQTRRSDKPLGAAPTVKELLASYHEAIGGLEANKKLTTRRMKGTMSVVGAPEPFKMTLIQKAPDLMYTKVEIPEFGAALEGHDGKVAWKSNPAEGTVALEGLERAQKLRDYQFHKYLDLEADFQTLASKGRETVKGQTYDVLAVTRADGSSETLYFDARTHLIGMVKRPEITLEISNYEKIDGIPYWRSTIISTPDGNQVMTFRFESVRHGIKVDDTLFAPPKE